MHKTFMKFVGTYATYSDIFGYKMTKEDIITFIKTLPLAGILNILSQLSHIPIDDKYIRKDFLDYAESLGIDRTFIKNRLDDRILYSEQGLLSLWKWLMAYGDENKIKEQSDIRVCQ